MSSQEKQQSPQPCAGGCGFYGVSSMQNYCSVCFKKYVPDAENVLKKQNEQNKEPNEDKKTNDPNSNNNITNLNDNNNDNKNDNKNDNENNDSNNNKKDQKKKNRCWQCNKKLALAQQFECKCGYVFCSNDRYADSHNCSFDYQKQQKQKLETLNPVVAASKVQQI